MLGAADPSFRESLERAASTADRALTGTVPAPADRTAARTADRDSDALFVTTLKQKIRHRPHAAPVI